MVNSDKIGYSLSINDEYKTQHQTKKIKNLVGRYAKRVKPFVWANGVIDSSFTDESVKILSISTDGSFTINFYGTKCNMDKEWDDKNWIISTALDSLD